MKKFAAEHLSSFITVFFSLILIVISLGVYIFLDFYAESEYAASRQYLAESMYKTNLRMLSDALDKNDYLESYRLALAAADTASSAGMENETIFMKNISAAIYENADSGQIVGLKAAVNNYLDTNEIGSDYLKNDMTRIEEYVDEWEPSSVSNYREAAALECASSVVGVDGVMKPAEQNLSGRYLFTCRNAYVMIDARSGSPSEIGISLSPGQNILSEAECVDYAENFLRKYFTVDIIRTASVVSVEPDPKNGLYNVTIKAHNKSIIISVRRDSGKIMRLITL